MFSSRTRWSLETNRLAQAMAEHRRHGREILDLTASNPPACGFDYPRDEILAALADPRALDYAPESKGRLAARRAIADYYRSRPGFATGGTATAAAAGEVDPERLILTSGTSEAYSHIFRLLCEPGDEVLIPAPSYPLFSFLADLADIHLVSYPVLYDHGWQIDFDGLRSALTPRSRAVLVVHPNNPTGSFVKPQEAMALAALCAEREMAIVADEVFLDYGAPSFSSPATFAHGSAALAFTLSGLSKISALPQMKLAWIAVSGPEALVHDAVERLDVIADTYLSPSVPVQLAAPRFLALGAALRVQILQRIASNLASLDAALAAPRAGNIARLHREAGWYAILRVASPYPDDESPDEALCVELLRTHSVLFHPGSFYNFTTPGFLVLSLITATDVFNEGIHRLVRFFEARG